MLDPAVRSPWLWLIDGKIVGADAVREQALKGGKFDYDAPIAGIEVVDRYTLRIRLKEPDLRFLYVFAIPNTARRRARSGRSVRARFRRASGRHGPVHAGRVQAQREDRAACESRLSRDDVRAGRTGAAGVEGDRRRARRARNCRSSAASRSR